MPARKNGPKAGPTHGRNWADMGLNTPERYKGTATGAKANASRANKQYPELRFRSFQEAGKVFIERIK